MADLLNFTGVRVLDSNAAPGAGYVARFYETGTTTPVTVYTSVDLGTPHGTSVTADAEGKFAAVWADGGTAVKCVIETAAGAVVQTIDPVFSTPSSTSAAEDIAFTPTVDLPYTNVQDAIEGAADASASGFATYGIGITGNATLLANIDATGTGAGLYRFDNTSTGTYPTGVAAADTGLIEIWRQAGATAIMFLYHATSDKVFFRRMASLSWGSWTRVSTTPATHTIWLPAASFVATTTAGATYATQELATNDVMVAGYDFGASTDVKVQTMIAMPKSWNESTVTAQVFWKDGATAGTGDVIWGVQALAVGNDDAMDAAFGTAQTVTDTFIASGDLHVTSATSAITAAGTPAENDLLIVQVYRDADAGGDTYTQNARFIGLKLLYTANAGDDA